MPALIARGLSARGFNPQRFAAETAAFFMPPKPLPGLPAVSSSPRAIARPGIGATQTNLAVPPGQQAGPIEVKSAPSMQVLRDPGSGGALTRLRRNTQYMQYVNPADVEAIRAIVDQLPGIAESMSRGALSYDLLRRLGHPYGRDKGGVGRSAPSLSIINAHSGDLAAAWSSHLEVDESGFNAELLNEVPYSWMLANGTRRLQAHGPFTAAMVKILPELDAAFHRMVANAYFRSQAVNTLSSPRR